MWNEDLRNDIAIPWGSAKQFNMILRVFFVRIWTITWTDFMICGQYNICKGGNGVIEKAECHILVHGFMVHSWFFQDIVGQQRNCKDNALS